MPRKRYTKKRSTKKSVVPKSTQKIRKLAGVKPMTWAETLARSAGPIGHLASSVATIAGLVNSEAKEVDTNIPGTGISNSGSFSSNLTLIQEGDDRNQRNGRFILAKHLQARMQFIFDPAVQSTFGWALVMDKKPNIGFTATPWTDVFVSVNPTAMINRDNADRFIILKRGLHGASSGSNLIQNKSVFINLKGIHLKFDGTASTDVAQNQIYLLAVSNQAVNTVALRADFRFEYYDN